MDQPVSAILRPAYVPDPSERFAVPAYPPVRTHRHRSHGSSPVARNRSVWMRRGMRHIQPDEQKRLSSTCGRRIFEQFSCFLGILMSKAPSDNLRSMSSMPLRSRKRLRSDHPLATCNSVLWPAAMITDYGRPCVAVQPATLYPANCRRRGTVA